MLPVLALGLEAQWEQREGRLWRRNLDTVPKITRVKSPPPPTPPALTPEQRAEALTLLRSGLSLRKVAAKFPGVSYGAIWRLLRAEAKRAGTKESVESKLEESENEVGVAEEE